jgi:hypothetical protein
VVTISLTLADATGKPLSRYEREVFLKAWRLSGNHGYPAVTEPELKNPQMQANSFRIEAYFRTKTGHGHTLRAKPTISNAVRSTNPSRLACRTPATS